MKFRNYSFLGVFVLLFALFYSGGPQPDTDEEKWRIDLIATVAREHVDLSAKFRDGDFPGMRGLLNDAIINTPAHEIIRPERIEAYWRRLKTPAHNVQEVRFKILDAKVIKSHFYINDVEYTAYGLVVCEYSYTESNPEGEIGTYAQVRRHIEGCEWDRR